VKFGAKQKMNLKIKKLHPSAKLPSYATAGAACFDLHANTYAGVGSKTSGHGAVTISTGLCVEVPDGHVMLIYSRSGHGFKNGVRLANCVGVIDADYRGEIMVRLTNDTDTPMGVSPGDRIAQAMIVPVERVTFEQVLELSDTVRGAGGFGSTGA
jgi:dUTP pyrophosphatase